MNSATDYLVKRYLDALHRADLDAIVSLFAPGAVVHSPLYGPTPAPDFYRALFIDTSSAELTSKGVAEGRTSAGTRLVTFWFHFDWRLPSGVAAPTMAASQHCRSCTTPLTCDQLSSGRPDLPGGRRNRIGSASLSNQRDCNGCTI
ncbi:nuclear transport factor 2 family protein [Rhodococcus sp. 15-649-2-2]|uniref:nuclear transport factor 2 family protein n=1 Tax=Rhodococcus sp. 15-649-2-2 TaxID=2023140 RepID=UPI001C52B62C|nr:nuclear transport factor 2 family protein [Rhodococcus sp. 15-649-2-2]